MSTFNDTGSGGIYGAGLALNTEKYLVNASSSGCKVSGHAIVPIQDILDAMTIGESCTTHGTNDFCCIISGNRRSVKWLRIKDAYVPAITICTQKLYS